MKYRKKPIVIEAVRWQPNAKPSDMPEWFWEYFWLHPDCYDDGSNRLEIRTLEGVMVVNPGDWIIRGVKGELYPCRDDIFRATYETEDDAAREAMSR